MKLNRGEKRVATVATGLFTGYCALTLITKFTWNRYRDDNYHFSMVKNQELIGIFEKESGVNIILSFIKLLCK